MFYCSDCNNLFSPFLSPACLTTIIVRFGYAMYSFILYDEVGKEMHM
jgi:hypothetical protein